jgi:peptide/nickel transport system substrate-binding protein
MCFACVGCSHKKQAKKQSATETAAAASQKPADASSEQETKLPEVEAGGKGNNKSDVPFVMACTSLEGKFNPFSAKKKEDVRAVDMTQLRLLTFDREGAVIKKAIQGETRSFRGESYHYQGPANIKIKYDKKTDRTTYVIRIKKDLTFSDGEPVTIDDVIFSMYAFADKSYQGNETFGSLPIVGLKQYRQSAKKIRGISRLGDYKVKIVTKGYQKGDVESLNIPVCPQHFYAGKISKKTPYGFAKGDISSLIQKKNSPIGAGAYRFIKYEKGVVYYEANASYYRGCPKTAFVQLKEIGDKTEEEILKAIAQGEYDMADMTASKEGVEMVRRTNSNGKIIGKTFGAKLYDGERYAYIGMNVEKVCVGQKADSTRSKNLRRALAILFASGRDNVVELSEPGASVIDYPAAHVSWSVPQLEDEDYEQAYVKDVDGNVIYTGKMDLEERSDAACKAALGYLKQAGFKIKNGKVVKAGQASKRYVIYLPKSAQDTGVSLLVRNTQKLFKRIGLKLVVVDSWTSEKIETALREGRGELWCAFEETSASGDLYGMYHSTSASDKKAGARNYFQIRDSDLDEYIEESLTTVRYKKSTALYRQCYEKIFDWAVEVPVYQERNMTVFSTDRVNYKTLPENTSPYYDWCEEIEQLEMN